MDHTIVRSSYFENGTFILQNWPYLAPPKAKQTDVYVILDLLASPDLLDSWSNALEQMVYEPPFGDRAFTFLFLMKKHDQTRSRLDLALLRPGVFNYSRVGEKATVTYPAFFQRMVEAYYMETTYIPPPDEKSKYAAFFGLNYQGSRWLFDDEIAHF